jgi:hypothetical protein
VVHASDYVLTVLGLALDRVLREQAPGAALRFVPNTPTTPAELRDGGSDLAVGIYGDLPPGDAQPPAAHRSLRVRGARRSPGVGKRLTLEQFVRLAHIQVAPRGKPGGYVDEVLRRAAIRAPSRGRCRTS